MADRQVLINLHTDTKDKFPEAANVNLGEIVVNHNSDSPFLAIKTEDADGNEKFSTSVMTAELSEDIDAPEINNGKLSIPWKYNELLSKYNDMLNRLIAVENELGLKDAQIYLEQVAELKDDWKYGLVSATSNTGYSYSTDAVIQPTYDDSQWDVVSVPHDWAIYQDFNSSCVGSSDAAWLDGGDSWYRRTLPITSDMKGKKVMLYFDGVFMESYVFVNGTQVNENHYGYNPFYVDCTDYLDFTGGNNVVAVFVRSNQPNSRFYAGAGIIRNVALLVGHEESVGIGNVIVSTPNISSEYTDETSEVTTRIKTQLTASAAVAASVTCEVLDGSGTVLASSKKSYALTSGSTTDISMDVKVKGVKLWAIGEGNLYTAKVKVLYDTTAVYRDATFGYRWFTFDKTAGFSLNGVSMKLKGVCLHEDHGCLGMEVNEIAYDRQLRKLEKMGINAVRTAHNQFPKEFIDLCNRHGLLVLADVFDEWNVMQAGIINETNGYYRFFDDEYEKVLRNMMARDVNAPCIFGWLIGNEIFASSYTQDGALSVANGIKSIIREYDDYRPLTMGDNYPSATIPLAVADVLDIEGINYGSSDEYTNFRAAKPNMPLFGSETTSAVASRDNYTNDSTNKQCSSFDDQLVSWAEGSSAAEILKRHMEDFDYLMGMFVWTGSDYLGEPTPYAANYPAKSSYFGIIDMAGFPKDIYYMYQSRWTDTPMIHIVGSWEYDATEASTATRTIWLYSNCPTVELFLNGTSVGSKTATDMGDKYNYVYTLTFTAGTLVANGYDSAGTVVAQDIKYTSQGSVSSVNCYCDNSEIKASDLAFIECDLVDKNGVRVPTANDSISFTGNNCTIVATDAGNAVDTTNMRATTKNAFNGKILAVVKPTSTGELYVTTNFTTNVEEDVKCGENRVFRDRTHTFIDATNPTIYTYNFDDPDFTALGTTIYYENGSVSTPSSSSPWTLNIAAMGADVWGNAMGIITYSGSVTIDCSTGIYMFVSEPSSAVDYYYAIYEIDANGNVIDEIDVQANEVFALTQGTEKIMVNIKPLGTTSLSTSSFDDATKFGLREYPTYSFTTVTSLAWNENKLSFTSSDVGGSKDALNYLTYAPTDGLLSIKRELVVTSSDAAVAEIHNNRYIKILATGTTTLTASIDGISTSCSLEVTQSTSDWDIEWDGSTSAVPENMSLSICAVAENPYSDLAWGGTYAITASDVSNGVYLYNGTTDVLPSKVEVSFVGTTSGYAGGWAFGVRVSAGGGYCAQAVFKGGTYPMYLYGGAAVGTALGSELSSGAVHTIVIETSGTGSTATYTATVNGTAVENLGVAASSDVANKAVQIWLSPNTNVLSVKLKR